MIVEDCQVFVKFDKVLENFLEKCPDVDIRRLKRSHLMMTLNKSRLTDLNSIFRSTGSPPESEEEFHTEDAFQLVSISTKRPPNLHRNQHSVDNQPNFFQTKN